MTNHGNYNLSSVLASVYSLSLKRQPHKMVKHTRTKTDELFECVWSFVRLALKGLTPDLH